MKYTMEKYVRVERLLAHESNVHVLNTVFLIHFNQFTFVYLRDGDVQYHHKTDTTKHCNSHDSCCLTVASPILTVGFIVKITYVIFRNHFAFIVISSVS